VLAAPLSTVYAAGRDSYVFVRSGDEVRPVKVALGEVNETHAQIIDGVTSGQQVLILEAGQGRALLDKAGIKVQQNKQYENFPVTDQPPPTAVAPGARGGDGDGNGGRRGGRGDGRRGRPASAPATAPSNAD